MKKALERELARLKKLYDYYLINAYKTFDYDDDSYNGYSAAMFKVRDQMYNIQKQLEEL